MTKIFNSVKNFFKKIFPTKRRLIQLYSALLFNANLKGYISGNIFEGITKNICTPGLNCYSCPGAVTACPLGALQNAFSASKKTAPYYMLGIIMLYCIMFGRWICGWLCPFGLVQDLLHKIPSPKLKKNKVTKVLSYFKYVVLIFFVVIVPLAYAIKDFPLPAFCKYICPAGTFGGAIGLLINPANSDYFPMLGPLFTWKFALMVSFIVGAVFIYRIFCRFVCPLGALYGIFNKFAIFGIKLEKRSCVNCGKCVDICKMDISEVGDHECIQCGKCIDVCPTKAISWKGSKIILPENEIVNARTDEEREVAVQNRNKKKKIITSAVAAVLSVTLIFALVYYNFIDKEIKSDIGANKGDACYAMNLEKINGDGYVNIDLLHGKVVVINFWGTWCGPCKAELPYFDEVATEYGGKVAVIAVHSVMEGSDTPESYISENYADSKILWVRDQEMEGSTRDLYYSNLGGKGPYPMTLVLDKNGVISFSTQGSLEKDELVAAVEEALNK